MLNHFSFPVNMTIQITILVNYSAYFAVEIDVLHSRIREIRKKKGMTLQQVADLCKPTATTAQTIGRLETGMRTLSVGWIDRIADALGVDAAELLATPGSGDVLIKGAVNNKGAVITLDGVLNMRQNYEALALRIDSNQAGYQKGDHIVFRCLKPTKYPDASGKDCLVEDTNGQQTFGKLIYEGHDCYRIAPLGASGTISVPMKPVMIAVAELQIRKL